MNDSSTETSDTLEQPSKGLALGSSPGPSNSSRTGIESDLAAPALSSPGDRALDVGDNESCSSAS
jgi:hypothetical protein